MCFADGSNPEWPNRCKPVASSHQQPVTASNHQEPVDHSERVVPEASRRLNRRRLRHSPRLADCVLEQRDPGLRVQPVSAQR